MAGMSWRRMHSSCYSGELGFCVDDASVTLDSDLLVRAKALYDKNEKESKTFSTKGPKLLAQFAHLHGYMRNPRMSGHGGGYRQQQNRWGNAANTSGGDRWHNKGYKGYKRARQTY